MKILILYVVGICLTYGALRYMLEEDIVSNYDCFVTSLCWILAIPIGIIMSIIEFIKQSIRYHKEKGAR